MNSQKFPVFVRYASFPYVSLIWKLWVEYEIDFQLFFFVECYGWLFYPFLSFRSYFCGSYPLFQDFLQKPFVICLPNFTPNANITSLAMCLLCKGIIFPNLVAFYDDERYFIFDTKISHYQSSYFSIRYVNDS